MINVIQPWRKVLAIRGLYSRDDNSTTKHAMSIKCIEIRIEQTEHEPFSNFKQTERKRKTLANS